jgi:NAD(P)-dependent dehydrogenase (short-subunit alcohol dehydrogenase family)
VLRNIRVVRRAGLAWICFTNQVAIVTEAARGIGRIIAERFAPAEGAQLSLADLDSDGFDRIATELEDTLVMKPGKSAIRMRNEHERIGRIQGSRRRAERSDFRVHRSLVVSESRRHA